MIKITYEDIKTLPIFMQIIAIIFSIAIAYYAYQNMFIVIVLFIVVYIILMPKEKKPTDKV